MAFVRWRGLCAQLLTTVYDKGRSRQVLLANLHSGYTVPIWIRTQVQEQFPLVSVDWSQVEEALAKGPPGTPELTQEQWDCLRVEQALRAWSENPHLVRSDASILKAAAHVLANRREQISLNA